MVPLEALPAISTGIASLSRKDNGQKAGVGGYNSRERCDEPHIHCTNYGGGIDGISPSPSERNKSLQGLFDGM